MTGNALEAKVTTLQALEFLRYIPHITSLFECFIDLEGHDIGGSMSPYRYNLTQGILSDGYLVNRMVNFAYRAFPVI